MDRLKDLTDTLDSIKNVSNDTMQAALDLLQSISNDDLGIVEDLKEELPGVDTELILSAISAIISTLVADAERVSAEIDLFILSIVKGKNTLEKRQESYMFLYQVWSGDVYDQKKLSGMKALLIDLQRQLLCLNGDYVLIETIKKLAG